MTATFPAATDVTVLSAPIKKLMIIAQRCTDELEAYSRLIGKHPEAAQTPDGILLLPVALWPASAQAVVNAWLDSVREQAARLRWADMRAALGIECHPLDRERVKGLARSLENVGIGLEPHVLAGAKGPGDNDTVVLFALPTVKSVSSSLTTYPTASLAMQVASVMARTDGGFRPAELLHLRAAISTWPDLTATERCRLEAHLLWLSASPMTWTPLTKKLSRLSPVERQALARFMIGLAQTDVTVPPLKVRFLERLYGLLGLDAQQVFRDLHRRGAGSGPASASGPEGLRLDPDRVALLQAQTARVGALLSDLFAETAEAPAGPTAVADASHTLLGLDPAHTALLRSLLSQARWTRVALVRIAGELDLMLDGALEQLNEAVLDACDEPLFDGDDPVSVSTHLRERIDP